MTHPDEDTARADLDAFLDDVAAAAKAHGIVTFLAAGEAGFPPSDDRTGRVAGSTMVGNASGLASLAAQLYGAARRRVDDALAADIAHGERAAKRKR